MLAVATAGEAAELRAAGLTAPLLIMGAVSAEELPVALGAGAEVVAWNERFVAALAAAAGGQGGRERSTSTSSSTAAWAGWARVTPSEAFAVAASIRDRARRRSGSSGP